MTNTASPLLLYQNLDGILIVIICGRLNAKIGGPILQIFNALFTIDDNYLMALKKSTDLNQKLCYANCYIHAVPVISVFIYKFNTNIAENDLTDY